MARVAVGNPADIAIEQAMGQMQREDVDTEYKVPSGRETVVDKGGRIARLSISVSVAAGAEPRSFGEIAAQFAATHALGRMPGHHVAEAAQALAGIVIGIRPADEGDVPVPDLDQMLGLMTNDYRLLRVAFDINRNQNMGFAVALGVIGVGVLDAVHDDRERMGQFVVKLLKESPTHKFGDG